jgi:hypothetical protein
MTRESYEVSEEAWLETEFPRGAADPDFIGYAENGVKFCPNCRTLCVTAECIVCHPTSATTPALRPA